MEKEERLKFIHEIPKDVSSEELISILKYNTTVASDMKKKCQVLQQVNTIDSNSSALSVDMTDDEFVSEDNEEQLDENLDDLYAFYYKPILDLDCDSTVLEQELIDLLPDIRNKKFFQIVGRIQLELFKAEKEYLDLYNEVKDSLNDKSSEFSNQLEKELFFYRQKREIISEYISTPNQKLSKEEEKEPSINHLIYLPTVNGNLYINNDLLAIPIDYYDSFRDLFLSIQDGSFKNFKRLVGNNYTTSGVGISEVKDYQSRIVFDRIGSKSYAILDVFVKKVNTDKEYNESLVGRINAYRRVKASLVHAIQDSEYMQRQDEITEEILKSLAERNRDKIRTIGKV